MWRLFGHYAVRLKIRPYSLPNRVLHRMRTSTFPFNLQYPVLSSRSFNVWSRLLPCLPVTSILPSILRTVTYFRKQFLRKICPIQSAFLLYIECRIFFSLKFCNFSSLLKKWVQMIFSILLQYLVQELPSYF